MSFVLYLCAEHSLSDLTFILRVQQGPAGVCTTEVGLYNTAVACVHINRLHSCACRVTFDNDVDISCEGTQGFLAAALNDVHLLGPVCCPVLLVAVLVKQARLNGSS